HRLDEHMTDPGFNISIHVDWDNGLLFGGNIWNCGTWMDKMGSSENAKNRGVPSTPRDGAAIEIVALLFNCLRWVSTLSAENPKDFPYTGVHVPFSALGESPLLKTCSSSQSIDHTDDQQLFLVDFGSWADLILSSFEKHFWIPINPKKDQRYSVDTSHVLRRGIYRDTFGSAVPGADYCFRPNLVVAMVISPRLFITKHARYCLSQVRRLLQGPLGMRTLDPLHPNYNPNYNNDDNSSNPLLANGANYHNGPEWLWQTGFYLRALIKFFNSNTDEIISTFYDVIHKSAFRLNDYISNKSSYRGLTELTNIDGSECVFSNPTQAWSSASILALLRDIDTFVLEYDIKLP
ncbi:Glycogen debranching enzyme, partial [Zancudomyces culisetae]